jgi:4-hydroxy-tetrahydrodipicolinate reductase
VGSVVSPAKKIGVALFGAGGRMGQALVEQISKIEKVELLARIERESGRTGGYVPLKDLAKLKPDVVIDFSSPDGAMEICRWCLENQTALVTGSTGLNDVQIGQLKAAAEKIRVFMSPNMSPGLNGLASSIQSFLSVFNEGDVVIEETHHNQKKDAPSGTAKFLQSVVKNSASKNIKLTEPISIRGGDVFGIHKISFFADGEWVSFEHHATSRMVFARGALMASQWIVSQPPGFYEMGDLLKKPKV